ncbi:muscarinic acetylcholine receptor M4-like [Apostichopus japonicus]|uniref:muscarinic acetylcholine receptor M4-like n=1 Tax=Stichopus japonicus TaxID=307972 RepID=UPI003AB912CA
MNLTTQLRNNSSDLEPESAWSAGNLLRLFSLIFGLIGLLGNGLVLFVFIRVPSLRNITNLYIGNQSFIDLLSSCFLILSKYLDNNADFKNLGPVTGLLVCVLWTSDYIFWALLKASTMNLLLLTLERYTALEIHVFYRRRFNRKKARASVVLPWIFGFVVQIYWPAVFRVVENQCYPDWRTPQLQAFAGFMVFVFQYVLPISMMLTVYIKIFRSLRNKVSIQQPHPRRPTDADALQLVGRDVVTFPNRDESTNPRSVNGNDQRAVDVRRNRQRLALSERDSHYKDVHNHSQSDISAGEEKHNQHCSTHAQTQQHQQQHDQKRGHQQKQQQQKLPNWGHQQRRGLSIGNCHQVEPARQRDKIRFNVIKTLICVALVFIICWTPNQIIYLLYNLGLYDLDFDNGVYVASVLLAFCNIWINPFIYTFQYERFQKGLSKAFRV